MGSLCETDSRLAGQEISWEQKVYYRVQKRPPLDTILSQLSPYYAAIFMLILTYKS
jgi:hypothetical protein